MPRPRVILLSPFAGPLERNLLYARAALRDSIERGEAPFASHLLYPQVLDDSIAVERRLAFEMELEWLRKASEVVAYIDYGISPGMELTIKRAEQLGLPVARRQIEDKVAKV